MMDRPARRRRAGRAAIAMVALAGVCVVPVRGAQVVDRVIAVVSGTVIMLSDARAALTLGLFDPGSTKDPVEAAMRWLIDRQLALDEAGRSDRVDGDPAELVEALGRVRQRFASDSEYQRVLAGLGLDDAGLQRFVGETLTARQYIERRFDSMPPPGEEELRAYYTSHASRFVRNGRQMTFDEALADLTAVLQQERRDQAVAAWMDRLRRRADIREIYQSPR